MLSRLPAPNRHVASILLAVIAVMLAAILFIGKARVAYAPLRKAAPEKADTKKKTPTKKPKPKVKASILTHKVKQPATEPGYPKICSYPACKLNGVAPFSKQKIVHSQQECDALSKGCFAQPTAAPVLLETGE